MRLFLCVVFSLSLLPLPAFADDVRLAWNWDAPSHPPLRYVVERKTGLAGTYAPVGYTTDTQWTDTDIPDTDLVALYWQVRAVNELGITDPSNEVSLNLRDAPGNIRLTVETTGPSDAAPRVSVRTRVKKKEIR